MWGLSGSLAVPGVLGVKAARARSRPHQETRGLQAPQSLTGPPSVPSWPFCGVCSGVCRAQETHASVSNCYCFTLWPRGRRGLGRAPGPGTFPGDPKALAWDLGFQRRGLSPSIQERQGILGKAERGRFCAEASTCTSAPSPQSQLRKQSFHLFCRLLSGAFVPILSHAPHTHPTGKTQPFPRARLLTWFCDVKSILPTADGPSCLRREGLRGIALISKDPAQPLSAQCSGVGGHL